MTHGTGTYDVVVVLEVDPMISQTMLKESPGKVDYVTDSVGDLIPFTMPAIGDGAPPEFFTTLVAGFELPIYVN